MDAIETILSRKSVRSFKEKEIEDEKLDIILKAAMAAPSAMNRQPWFFYVAKSKEKIDAIRGAMMYGKYEAAAIIIVCGKELAELPIGHDIMYCDLGAASENILLAAHAQGLGGVWCAIYPSKNNMKNIAKVIGAPLGVTPYSAIYLGYPSDDDKSQVKDKFNEKNYKII